MDDPIDGKERVAPPSSAIIPPKTTFKGMGLSKKYVAALEDMAYKGTSNTMAAQAHGVRIDNLTRAFHRPHVKAVYNQILKETRSGAAVQAYQRNVELAQTSKSDTVKADLNKWLAGVDGISPVRRVEGKHSVSHSFDGFDYDEPGPKDITPIDQASGSQGGQVVDD